MGEEEVYVSKLIYSSQQLSLFAVLNFLALSKAKGQVHHVFGVLPSTKASFPGKSMNLCCEVRR